MKTSRLNELLKARGFRMADLARQMGVERSTVSRWGTGTLSAERAVEIERITGIPREQLRPDIFQTEQAP